MTSTASVATAILRHAPETLYDDLDRCACGWQPDARFVDEWTQWAHHVAAATQESSDMPPLENPRIVPPDRPTRKPMTRSEARAKLDALGPGDPNDLVGGIVRGTLYVISKYGPDEVAP